MRSDETVVDGRLHGLNLRSRFPLRSRLAPMVGEADVEFVLHPAGDSGLLSSEEAAYESPFRNLAGESVVRVHRLPGADHLEFPGIAEFEVGEDSILATLLDPAQEHMVEILLLSTVFAFHLERAGILALHASAVCLGRGAVVFLSGKEAGKTCLAMACAAAGDALLADDLLAVEVSEDEILARPSHPTVRLWPEAAEHFLPGHRDLPLVHPDYRKRRVSVGEGAFGRFGAVSAPILRIYLPIRRPPDDPDDRVRVTPVPPAEATLALARHSFAAPMMEGLGWQGRRLARLAEIVRRVPLCRLSYPSGFGELPRVRGALLADLQSG